MATVFRQDTGELVGYLTEPEGPFPGGITYWPFKAWVQAGGQLRCEPEPGMDEATRALTLNIPVRNNDSADLHLIVPPDLVDFIVTHKAFRKERLAGVQSERSRKPPMDCHDRFGCTDAPSPR